MVVSGRRSTSLDGRCILKSSLLAGMVVGWLRVSGLGRCLNVPLVLCVPVWFSQRWPLARPCTEGLLMQMISFLLLSASNPMIYPQPLSTKVLLPVKLALKDMNCENAMSPQLILWPMSYAWET